ncbi:cyclic GMP-AMP synthase [Gouania willdenowi]|uniref:cyclic GMP-AMP synthase n=1 Tax=Gouania willdenowi TaxID=441366 RepID=UPI001055D622|nr:cyclic GMP-AMP synthase-like [Gouania willdenowi]
MSDPVSPELTNWIKVTAKEIKVRQDDRSWATEVVNHFRENLLKFLKSSSDAPLFESAVILNTGSYFEKVKIHSPNEFDMMLMLQRLPSSNVTCLDGGLFYRIDLQRPTRHPIKDFVLENELTVSSSRVLNEVHRLVRKFIKTYKAPDKRCRWEVNRKRMFSPAVTLSLCRSEKNSEELISVDVVAALEVQTWPSAVRDGPDVGNWLGKKVRQEIRGQPCYFVPKRLKGRNVNVDAKESWRISFSHIEKKLIACHGNKKTCCESKDTRCCRKQCLMLLKSLIEGLKQTFPEQLEDLCSYHGKTTFLHTLSSRYDDSMWACPMLPSCFLLLVTALKDHAQQGVLPHFFAPNCNLFSPSYFPRKKLLFLVEALEDQLRDGLPLLKPQTPVCPLRSALVNVETPQLSSVQTNKIHIITCAFVIIIAVVSSLAWM